MTALPNYSVIDNNKHAQISTNDSKTFTVTVITKFTCKTLSTTALPNYSVIYYNKHAQI